MAKLTLPGGRVIKIPDGLSPEQVQKIVTTASQGQSQPVSRRPQNEGPPPVTLAPGVETGGGGLGDYAAQFGSGIVEGVGSLAQAGNYLNPLSRLPGLAMDGLEAVGLADPETSQAVEDIYADPNKLITPYLAEEDPDYAYTRKGGQFLGGDLPVTLATGGGGLVPKIGLSIAQSQLANAGDTGARALADRYFPGNSWTGEAPPDPDDSWYDYVRSYAPGPQDVAGFIGAALGGAAPTAVGASIKEATKRTWGDNGPPNADPDYVTGRDVFEAAERQNLPVTGGMLAGQGQNRIGSTEQWVASWPLGGGKTKAKMDALASGMQENLSRTARKARAVVDPRSGRVIIPGGVRNSENLPSAVTTLAKDNADAIETGVRQQYDAMENLIGTDTALDVTPVQTVIKRQGNKASAVDKPGIDETSALFEADRVSPIDTALDKQLRSDLKIAERQLKNAQNPKSGSAPQIIKAMEKRVQDIQKQIDKNTGTTFGNLKRQQAAVRDKAFPGPLRSPSVPEALSGNVESAITKIMEKAARAKGMSGREFRRVRDEFRRAMSEDPLDNNTGLVPRLKRVAAKEDKAAESWLKADNLNRHERLSLLAETTENHARWLEKSGKAGEAAMVRQRFRQIAGDLIEETGDITAGQSATGSQFSSGSFATRMGKLKSPESKAILSGGDPEIEQSLADLVTVSKGARTRGREINTSNTAKIGQLAAIGRGIARSPVRTLLGAIPAVTLGKGLDSVLASEWLPRALVYGGGEDLPKILERAARSGAMSATLSDEFGGPR